MDRFVVVHYHELGLKKGNRDYFENRLCRNLRETLSDCGCGEVRRISGRILITLNDSSDIGEVRSRLANVPGVAHFSEAWKSDLDLSALESNAWFLAQSRQFESFRVDAHRGDKDFPHTSVEINQRVGGYLKERCGKKVDLRNAELTVSIEVVNKAAYLYVDRVPGIGGLPASTSGKVVVLLSGGIDSPVAGWKMIRRGCTAIFVHFHSFPYTTRESQEKAKQLATELARFQLRARLFLVPFAEVQRQIMAETRAETRVILYRRYMMRLAEKIAYRERARLLVTGDSIGQVASQTIENIDVVSRAVSMPILRPLAGDDKREIIQLARQIGTYDISIQPDQDCCSLFVPKHPETRARLEQVEASEQRLDVTEAMRQALRDSERLLQYAPWNEARVP